MTLKSLTLAEEGADDADLLVACRGGDVAALGPLFDRYGGRVRGFLARYVGGRASDLDDLVSATFLEAFRAAPTFRREASLGSWLLGIAVNVSRHWRRGEARRGAFLRFWGTGDLKSTERPDDRLEHRQIAGRIEAALAALPAPLRAAFLLCEVEELSGREAGAALGIPAGTVGRHLHEARQALREALEDAR